ncbi:hypothetical protein OMR58_08460 [Erwinia sp. INIA-01]|uniref:hypothetical protein n=1 Tax=Erwinia sp. INIA01 TaxID=2991500 RepID=UPI002225ADE9|nr:hypothetical protein [Erwinia sp. INIA01]MCW1874480.1 hypothetical protein [Erwinia sp. INIA01]
MPDIRMTQRVIHIHLASWRFFSALALPPLLLALLLFGSYQSALLLLLFLLTQYYCWRLWLDERLFQLVNSEDDLAAFDAGMARLWAVKPGATRSLEDRWLGARRILHRAICALICLWLVAIFSTLWMI